MAVILFESIGVFAGEINISDMDDSGKVIISGSVDTAVGRPISVIVKNSSVDAVNDYASGIRMMDSAVNNNGSFSFILRPADSGIYNVLVNGGNGKEKLNKSFEVKAPIISASNVFEKPGTNGTLYVDAAYVQNAQKISFELDYDTSVLNVNAQPAITFSNGFALESISVSGGKISVVAKRTGESVISKTELCSISVSTLQTAAEGQYNITINNCTITDKRGNSFTADTENAKLNIVQILEREDMLIKADEAMKDIEKKFDEEDYYVQKALVDNAETILTDAFAVGVRENKLNQTYYSAFKSAKIVLEGFKPQFTALEEINAAQIGEIDAVIEKYLDLFQIDADIWNIYKKCDTQVTEKDSIEKTLTDTEFKLPKNYRNDLYNLIVLSMVEKTNWSGIGGILDKVGDKLNITDSKYTNLSHDKKAEVWRAIGRNKYNTLNDLKSAITGAIEKPEPVEKNTVVGGSGRGGKSTVNSSSPLTVPKTDLPLSQKPSSYPHSVIFKDIDMVPWAKEAINSLSSKGVINGKSEEIFEPDSAVTREEFVKMIVCAFGIESDIDCEFTDVDKSAWYYKYICTAVSKGIVNGVDESSFGIGDFVTREDMAVILSRSAKYFDIALDNTANKTVFGDNEKISNYAIESVYEMQRAGIINGVEDNTFDPKGNATRAMAAKVIYQIIKLKNTLEAKYEKNS